MLAKIRSGELDARRVLLAPEKAPGAGDLTVEALVTADPALGSLGDQPWSRIAPERDVRISELEPDRRSWVAELVSFWRTAPGDVSRITSPSDDMYAATPDLYFPTGALSLRCVRLAMLEASKTSCDSILDFACGWGRAARYFRAVFPDARLVVSDINHDAVDFCAEEFGAEPVYSSADFKEVQLPGTFDLIWVGSLFTHVDEPRWIELLELLHAALAPEGLLVFTVQGRKTRREFVAGEEPWSGFFDEDTRDAIVRAYDEGGYGYADWEGRDYGSSLNSLSWVTRQIEARPGLRLIGYREGGWGRQDVVTCQAHEW